MQVLECRELCKNYPSFCLKNVSFSMQQGTIMGLIGKNGAGKTTTLKSMLHIVKPDGGSVRMFGMDMDTDELKIREKIGYVSGAAGYYPAKTLKAIAAVTKPFYPDWDEAVYRDCLRRFALEEGKKVRELSEGMKVKFQLALALSHHAQLLILDEPTSGLDPVSRDDLLELFLTLTEKDGVSILFSTHITSDLEKCADTVTYIQNGSVFATGGMDDVLGRYRVYRGTEETHNLLGKRTHRGQTEGLLRAEDCTDESLAKPTLEELMIYTEREAEA